MRRLGIVAALILPVANIAANAVGVKQQPINHVGLATRVFHPTATRNWRGAQEQDLRCIIWYPAADTAVDVKQTIGPPHAPLFEAGTASPHAAFAPSLSPYPLILLSHGTGGSSEQLAWLGTALAKAGYIAVAVDHPGNNSHEPYTPEGFALWWERAIDLSEVLDGMLADKEFAPHIDDSRIAAAGYSIGGFTVLELAGAQTDINEFFDLCSEKNGGAKTDIPRPDVDTTVCHVPEMRNMGTVDDVLKAVRKTSRESLARSGESYADPRIKAVFAIAPALGFTFTEDSLHTIQLPVEIVAGSADRIASPRENADYIRSYIHGARETVLPKVTHYTFLDTCTTEGKQKLDLYCTDQVDRDVIHAQVSTQAIKFFNRALRM
jgi:predicted dienelactone hydrolase